MVFDAVIGSRLKNVIPPREMVGNDGPSIAHFVMHIK